jgi:hypothetical protein
MTSSNRTKENNTMRTTLGGAVLLLAVAATTTACGGSGTDATPPPSPKSSTAPTSSAPADPRDQAQASAEAVIKKYFQVTDQIGQDKTVPISRLKSVAISSELNTEQHWFKRWRSSGWTQTGDTQVTKMQVGQITLDNSNPSQGKVPAVTIDVCVDASGTKVTDRSGKQIGHPIALSTTRYIVANYQYKQDPAGGWRVASSEDKADSKCTL